MKGIPCPVCLHKVRIQMEEPYPVGTELMQMRWHQRRGGAGAAVVSRWDGGCWVCEVCGFRATKHDAAVLLDAVLRCPWPLGEHVLPTEVAAALVGGEEE